MTNRHAGAARQSECDEHDVEAEVLDEIRRREFKTGACWGSFQGLAEHLKMPLPRVHEAIHALIATTRLFLYELADRVHLGDVPADVRLFSTTPLSAGAVSRCTRLALLFTAEPRSPACPAYPGTGLPDFHREAGLTTWSLCCDLIA